LTDDPKVQGVEERVCVGMGISDGTTVLIGAGVFVGVPGVAVIVGVAEGVGEGVSEGGGVRVTDGVEVIVVGSILAVWVGVNDRVTRMIRVAVGVGVKVCVAVGGEV
jgi:hypothetical protein